MRLELIWARLRRAGLRLLWKSYVHKMVDKRQGECPNCPHDIIDSRDLKYYRNVCGYWFRREDDPYCWRDQLGVARLGAAEMFCSSLVFGTLCLLLLIAGAHWGCFFWLLLPVVAVPWFFTISFFRDPQRDIPSDPDAVLSPADGTVTHIGEVEEPDFPDGQAFRISIFLSIFNVHVNRIPRSGKVVGLHYFRGSFLDARHEDAARRNEQFWIDLEEENTGRKVRIKQIAGAVARRTVCWLKMGERVHAGDRPGMIKFGSRTEVYLPVGDVAEVYAKVGDKVKGASTVLLRVRRQ